MTQLTYTDGEPVQVGDRVTVEADVSEVGLSRVRLETKICSVWVAPDEILSHSSPPIKAGDMVKTHRGHGPPACVKCVDGKEAWLLLSDGTHFTAWLSDLRKVTP